MDDQVQFSELGSKPLTDWKNAPTVRDLKQDYDDAKPTHDSQKTKISVWLDNLNVTGEAKVNNGKNRSSVVPKLIRKQAEWRYPALSEPFLSTDELFNVSPVTWEDRDAAKQNQLVLNQQFNLAVDKTAFIDELVRAAVDEGTVIIRTGWKFEEEEYTDTFPVVEFVENPGIAPMYEQLAAMKDENPAQFESEIPDEIKQAFELTQERGIPVEAVVTGYQEETRMRTVHNHPTVEVCDYRNVVFDRTCLGDLDKANFVVYSFESSLSELKKDGKYKNLDQIKISTNSILGEPDHATNDFQATNFADKPRQKFVVY